MSNLNVQASNRDIRSDELLGESINDRDGKYEIAWSQSQLSSRSKKTADIALKVLTREKKTLLFASDIDSARFNVSEKEEINITIEKLVMLDPAGASWATIGADHHARAAVKQLKDAGILPKVVAI